MNRKRKRLIVGALVAVEVLICLAIVAGLATLRVAFPRARFFYVADTRAKETIEESFAPDGPATLDLSNTYGNVEVAAGEGDRFVVKALKETWGQNKQEAEAKLLALEVKMTMDGGTLRVQVEDPDSEAAVVFGSTRGNQVTFEVEAPRQAAVVVHTRHGHVTLKGTEGDADLTSRYGSIAVEDVTGSITVDTSHGDVTARHSGGEGAAVDLHSHYGDIATRHVTAGDLTLDSNNGALTLEEVTVYGDLALNTHYGRIDLADIRAGSMKVRSQNGPIALTGGQLDGELDLFTHYGTVNVSRTEASGYKIETNNGAIKLDGGRGPLWLHSRYGDIEIRDAYQATLDLNTANGRVSFEGSLSAAADHQVESNYGTVSLRLPPDTAVFLDAETNYGRIRCGFDVLVKSGGDDEESRSSGDELRGAINGGSDRLRVKTRNGDITIEAQAAE